MGLGCPLRRKLRLKFILLVEFYTSEIPFRLRQFRDGEFRSWGGNLTNPRSRGTFQGASVFLAFAALCAIYAAMTIESYAFLRYYNAFLGMASSVTMCFGVPVVFTMAMKKQPSTRAVVLGSLAISMLLGELTGFFLVWVCSFESATVISGILCLLGNN